MFANKRRSWPTALAAGIALLGAQGAGAEGRDPDNPTCPSNPNWSSYNEMRFTVQPRPGQPPVLLAEGAVDGNLISRLEAALQDFRGEEVWLRSGGGDARAGNQAGRIIRARGLRTRIPAGWACNGACTFMFMGGAGRHIDGDGQFSVQMFSTTGDTRDRTELARGSAAFASEDYDFLIRMGVSPRLLSEVMYRQNARSTPNDRSTRRCLTREEILEYRIAEVPASR